MNETIAFTIDNENMDCLCMKDTYNIFLE